GPRDSGSSSWQRSKPTCTPPGSGDDGRSIRSGDEGDRVVGARLRRPGAQRAAGVRVRACTAGDDAVHRGPGAEEKCLDGERPTTEGNDALTRKSCPVRLRCSDDNRAVEVQATDMLAGGADQRVRKHDAVAERRGRLTF